MTEKDNRDGDRKQLPELKGTASVRKPSRGTKIVNAFIAQEVHDVKDYVIFDVVIPAIKRTFRDLIVNTLDMTFYGKAGSDRRDDRDRRSPYVSYNAYSRRERDSATDRRERRYAPPIDIRHLDAVEFEYKSDADNAIGFLEESIEHCGSVTVFDFISCAGLRPSSVHRDWGWYDIGRPEALETPEGKWYVAGLPKPRPMD